MFDLLTEVLALVILQRAEGSAQKVFGCLEASRDIHLSTLSDQLVKVHGDGSFYSSMGCRHAIVIDQAAEIGCLWLPVSTFLLEGMSLLGGGVDFVIVIRRRWLLAQCAESWCGSLLPYLDVLLS